MKESGQKKYRKEIVKRTCTNREQARTREKTKKERKDQAKN